MALRLDPRLRSTIARAGFALLERALAPAELVSLRDAVFGLDAGSDCRGGIRSVLRKSARIRAFAVRGLPAALARRVLGPAARPVKGTVFDKRPDANWSLRWHQDIAIAVTERREVEGFGPWSVKDGIAHVRAPAPVLETMLAVRVHLDDAGDDNGALRVVPGSHAHGRLEAAEIRRLRAEYGEVSCPVEAGGIMVMAPLLLHASSKSERPARRRVLHIEYAASDLPGGLRWAD